ncbi:MAG: histone deacetylase, partial [Betaproteobacteria bacterium]
HEGDRLGRLKLSQQGLAERDRRVLQACGQRGIPVAVSMAGGYGHDIERTVDVHQETLAQCWQHWQHWQAWPNRAPGAQARSPH